MKYKYFILTTMIFFVGCSKHPFPSYDYVKDRKEVIASQQEGNLDIDAEFFADATISMSGFSSDPNSQYCLFLDDISSIVQTSFNSSKVKFFRFGKTSMEITQPEFLKAKTNSFYTESITNIDEVIKNTKKEKISVIITDLFQDQKNLLAVVTNLKESCLKKGLSLAVLGIASEFNGKVYDANVPPFDYKSDKKDKKTYRPFYAFMIGDDAYLMKFYNNLASKNTIYEDKLLLISKNYVKDFKIETVKPKESKGLTKKRKDNADQFESSSFWRLSEKSQIFHVLNDISLPAYMPPLTTNNVTTVIEKRSFDEKLGVFGKPQLSEDIKQEKISGNINKFTGFFKTSESFPKGINSYKIDFIIARDSEVSLPSWVTDFSSDDPTSAKGPNKTLNLDKFISDLIKASWVVFQPKVSITYLTIENK
ncbi:hypothetical protein MASR2M39_29850 [Ignavibacteriales bacterium]